MTVELSEYIDTVTIPLLKKEFERRDWSIVEWDTRIGYIEFEYTGIRDNSRIILYRNWYIRDLFNRNEWKVTFKITPAVESLLFEEIELIRSLMTALKLSSISSKDFVTFDDLFESDHDKIEEKKDYIRYILGEDS